jgi:hypothetical protein
MNNNMTFEKFSEDLDNGYKIKFDYVRNRYVLYKVNENCYMQELIEQKTTNPVAAKNMITFKAIKEMFPFITDVEYQDDLRS